MKGRRAPSGTEDRQRAETGVRPVRARASGCSSSGYGGPSPRSPSTREREGRPGSRAGEEMESRRMPPAGSRTESIRRRHDEHTLVRSAREREQHQRLDVARERVLGLRPHTPRRGRWSRSAAVCPAGDPTRCARLRFWSSGAPVWSISRVRGRKLRITSAAPKPSRRGHIDIEQHGIGVVLRDKSDGLYPVACFADDGHVGRKRSNPLATTQNGIIVCKDDPRRRS